MTKGNNYLIDELISSMVDFMFAQLPSLNSIKAFEAAARLRSFKEAANELSVSPTAVSHQVRGLEDKLQIRLFERKTREVSLTPEGERLALVANQTLAELMKVVNELTQAGNTLTISTTSSFATMWLVPRLADFQAQHPDIDVRIKADDSLLDIKQRQGVDLVIRYGHFNSEQEGASLLLRESLNLFATSAYWKSVKQVIKANYLCTRWKNPKLANINIEDSLKNILATKKNINIRYFDEENQIIQAALAGQGIALVSDLLVENPVKNGWLQSSPNKDKITLPGLDYYTIIPRWNQHNRAAQKFQAWLHPLLNENKK
ncbi:MAG: LysR substrate-binding domain-containing protein [Bermanella sp.]